MRREIKFRFWDKDLKKMYERKPAHNDFNHKNIIPLQFTGFKSQNGTDIYEGDIIKINKYDYSYYVKFENGSFQLYHNITDIRRWGLLSRMFDEDMGDLVCEVNILGNIYETTE